MSPTFKPAYKEPKFHFYRQNYDWFFDRSLKIKREKLLDLRHADLIDRLKTSNEALKANLEKQMVEVNQELSDMYTQEAWLNK